MATPRQMIHLQCLNQGLQSIADEVMRALRAQEFDPADRPDPPNQYCALITFNDRTEPELLSDRIAQWRHSWGSRVLAINLDDRPMGFDRTWELLRTGAHEVLNWQALTNPTEVIQARLERWLHVERLLGSPKICNYLAGSSPAWLAVLREIVEVAVFSQAPVLILGESGTGKELVARIIHDLDLRPFKQNLVLLDCSSIASELSGSEFFGHEKGAFTNAIATRDGAFSLADKGTLFLDEVGELPARLQAELLRVIQEGMFKRVGSNTWKHADFRLVCATNRDLHQEVQRKHFREDLFYRISTWVFTLPPLRERREDIPELVRFFLRKTLQTETVPAIDPIVMAYLETRHYPGNIRELRQLVTRIAARHVGPGPISVGDVASADQPRGNWSDEPLRNPDFINTLHLAIHRGWKLKEIVADVSNTAKDLAIHDADGNLQLAAEILNVTDRTLQSHQATKRGSNSISLIEGTEV